MLMTSFSISHFFFTFFTFLIKKKKKLQQNSFKALQLKAKIADIC